MEKSRGGDLALKLSVEVLEKRTPYDDALVRAKALNLVEPFIEGLNILVGRELFSLESAQHRLRSGLAERAAQGEGPAFELPSELEGWTLGGDNRPPLDPELFITWEIRVQQLLGERDEILPHLNLIDAALRQEERVASPWPGPAVVLIVTLGIALISHFQFGSMIWPAVSLGVGSVIALSLFRTAMKKFEAENHRIRMGVRKRVERKEELLEERARIDEHIRELRAKAEAVVDRAAPPTDEEIKQLYERFPGLFPKP